MPIDESDTKPADEESIEKSCHIVIRTVRYATVYAIVVLLNIDTAPHHYYHNCYQHHQQRLSISISIIIVIVIIIIVIIIIITVIVTIIVILKNIWGRRWCNLF